MEKASKKEAQKEISTAVHQILLNYDKGATVKSDKSIKFFTRMLLKKFNKEVKRAEKKRKKSVDKKKAIKKPVVKKRVSKKKEDK